MKPRETVFSPHRVYRYTLWRNWGVGSPSISSNAKRPSEYCQFIGLNPSTADETNDDPTVRRCINFAKAWGFGALCMTNAFAFRATDPKVMKAHIEPVGIGNDDWLVEIAKDAGIVIAAWGKDGAHFGRGAEVIRRLTEAGIRIHCLGRNQDGSPKHPLYLAAKTLPIEMTTTRLRQNDYEHKKSPVVPG